MLPEAQHPPTLRFEHSRRVAVAFSVRGELGSPPVTVASRARSVLRTPVPEATVDEHCQPLARKRDIDGPSALAWDGEGDPVPEAARMKLTTERNFRSGVASTSSRHPRRDFDPARARVSGDVEGCGRRHGVAIRQMRPATNVANCSVVISPLSRRSASALISSATLRSTGFDSLNMRDSWGNRSGLSSEAT